jgi:hypothetical protein
MRFPYSKSPLANGFAATIAVDMFDVLALACSIARIGGLAFEQKVCHK